MDADDGACGIGVGLQDIDVAEQLDTGPNFGCVHFEASTPAIDIGRDAR